MDDNDPRWDAIIDDPGWDVIHDAVAEHMRVNVQINQVSSSGAPVYSVEIDRGSSTTTPLLDFQTDEVSSSSTECKK